MFKFFIRLTMAAFIVLSPSAYAADISKIAAAPNGIEFPVGYENWPVISMAHRLDNETMRVILGNDIAIKAARASNTIPWPEGSVLAKVVWKQAAKETWPTAIAPDKFVHVEFMHKDSKKWSSTGGWGYARWTGLDLKPYGKDNTFATECVTCHTPVKDNDWVFTIPAFMATPK